mgnify:CR=1 FL=1
MLTHKQDCNARIHSPCMPLTGYEGVTLEQYMSNYNKDKAQFRTICYICYFLYSFLYSLVAS